MGHPSTPTHTHTHTHILIHFCSVLIKWQVVIIKGWRLSSDSLFLICTLPISILSECHVLERDYRQNGAHISIYLSRPCATPPWPVTALIHLHICVFWGKRDADFAPVCLWLIGRPLTANTQRYRFKLTDLCRPFNNNHYISLDP